MVKFSNYLMVYSVLMSVHLQLLLCKDESWLVLMQFSYIILPKISSNGTSFCLKKIITKLLLHLNLCKN